MEWVVIPIHKTNLISPTVPSYYTLHPHQACRRWVEESKWGSRQGQNRVMSDKEAENKEQWSE